MTGHLKPREAAVDDHGPIVVICTFHKTIFNGLWGITVDGLAEWGICIPIS
jgi:hypothetical protein